MRLGPVIILLLFFDTIWAQPDLHTVNLYTTKDGLSNNTIYCMIRDSRGFLWLGTKEGLTRFDGFQFKKYFSEKNNPRSLPNDNIFDVMEYRSGQLLIATSNGLSVLNTLTGQFENEKIGFAQIRAGSGTLINSMYRDKQSNIWINHDGELDILDSNLVYLYRFTDLDWAKPLKGIMIRFENWYTDKQNRLWIPSDTSGLHIVDLTAKKIYNSRNNPQQLPFLTSQSIRAFLYDEENNIICYAPWGDGLVVYNVLTGESKQQLFEIKKRGEGRTINSIIKTNTGKLLCFISDRCYEINNSTSQYKILTESSSFNNPVIQVITSLAINNHGTDQFIIGSSHGLYHLSGEKTTYRELSLIKPGRNVNMEECTDMIISRSGRLYCTYDNNLMVVVEKNREDFAHFMLSGQPNTNFTEVCEDHLNRIWIGTRQGIYFFDPVSKIFRRPDFLPAELSHLYINLIYCDNDGDVWVGTRNPFGLYRYMAGNNQTQKVKGPVTDHLERLGESNRISSIAEDKHGNLWMSSRVGGGLVNYDKEKDQWKLYPPPGRNYNFLVNKGFTSMQAGENNFLWLSNFFGDGLIRYDYKNDSILQFTRHDGLLGNYILNIISDPAKNLWLTTEYGVTQFNTASLKVQHTLSMSRPMADDQHVIIDSTNNTVVIPQDDRLLFIPTNKKPVSNSFPQPVVDKISVNNQVQFIDPQNHQLSLGHDQKNISIDYTAVGLFNNPQIHFAYKLTGVDEDWIYPGANRTAHYPVLAPGDYIFKLKVSNESGEWNPVESVFSFSIATPWWQTNFFRIAVVFLIAVIISLLFIKRVQVIRRESEMKQKIAETEMMALRAQMNPHFIFNCINSIDALIQSNDKYQATVYLNKFAKLIRNILDSSKQNVVTLSKDMETLQLYIDMEQFRNENKFTVNLKAEISLLQDDYKIPPLIIQPYVENAILHGLKNRLDSEGRLSVSVTRQNGQIEFIIEDNGVGRQMLNGNPPDGQGKQNNKRSYGMQMSQERIKIFNKEDTASVFITDLEKDGKAAGTKVQVLLNIQ